MNNWEDKIDAVFEELKDFQKETVNYAYQKLMENHRFLVADEVGLGKTKVAKGIIAKALKEHKDHKKTYQVYYICSNQALASQNLKDLNIFKDDQFVNKEMNRLVFLAIKNQHKQRFSLSSLTPSTSFRLATGTGQENERKLIYTILSKYSTFSNNKKTQRGLKWLMIGNVGSWKDWQWRIDCYESEYKKRIIKDVPQNFAKKLRSTEVEQKILKRCDSVITSTLAPNASYFDLLKAYCKALQSKRKLKTVWADYPERNKILAPLRRLLIEVCLENLHADLFILDEFQRFKDLVGFGQYANSEASKLAKKIFTIEGAKCLMLSATPFKLYTSRFEEAENENHYAELLDLLRFLYHDRESTIEEFEIYRKKYFEVLKKLDGATGESRQIKQKLEELYTNVLCRTEKLLVSTDKNNMTISREDNLLPVNKQDIENFIKTDQLFQSIKTTFNSKPRFTIDYSKSVPYPLSFMDGYKARKELVDIIDENREWFRKLRKTSQDAWINLDRLQDFTFGEAIPNPKYRYLQDLCFKDGMENLLWLPPSISYYESRGVFKDRKHLSKILIFSKWVMIPKMISGLLSYKVEQKTVVNKKFFPNAEQRYSWDTGKKKKEVGASVLEKRKPLPILALKLAAGKASAMRQFTLLYPSQTLKNAIDLKVNINEGKSYLEIRESLVIYFKQKMKETGIDVKSIAETGGDKDWYWAASIYLDFHNDKSREYASWIDGLDEHKITKSKRNDAKVNKANSEHISVIQEFYHSLPNGHSLGALPSDIFNVLADQALGAPAIAVNRSFDNHFYDSGKEEKMNYSLEIAYDFMHFFDKPETISVVRINEEKKDNRKKANRDAKDIYWNHVLQYCIDGNIQSMLDEYCHMLFSKNNNLSDLAEALSSGLNLRTSTIKIEGFKARKPNHISSKFLRCHFAVSFGNQRLETEEGQNRAQDVISMFNSPFRPFVLASTSIGQEGLDFHYYCRRIMHWNLPYSPIEMEQREGRINRYKGLVIRQNVAEKYAKNLGDIGRDIWKQMFDKAERIESKEKGNPELLPYWYTETIQNINIERIVPLLPFSKEIEKYDNLISVLALYRLTFGQPRQEELIKTFKDVDWEERDIQEIYKEYLFQLSPIKFNKKR